MKRIVYHCKSKHRFIRFIEDMPMRKRIRFGISRPKGIYNEEGS